MSNDSKEDTKWSYNNPDKMIVIGNQVLDLQPQIFELTNAIKGLTNAQSNLSYSSSSTLSPSSE